MHFCHEELFALMALLPGFSYLMYRLKSWWHSRKVCSCPNNQEAANEDHEV